jgi:hypothetical protein
MSALQHMLVMLLSLCHCPPKCVTNLSYGLLYMADHQIIDEVWQHGQNAGASFTCNYCGCTKRGGGATRFKQHLAACGFNVKYCGSVPPDVQDYFCHDINRTTENRRARQRQSLLREEVATEGNVVHNIDSDNDEELECAIHLSREEVQYVRRV